MTITTPGEITWIGNKEMAGIDDIEITRSSNIMAHLYVQLQDVYRRKTKGRLHSQKETMPVSRAAESPNDIHGGHIGWKDKKVTIIVSYFKTEKAHPRNNHTC